MHEDPDDWCWVSRLCRLTFTSHPWARIAALLVRWELDLEPRFAETPGSPGNFVAPAQRRDGTWCVLKVSPHVRKRARRSRRSHCGTGRGAARRLAAEPRLGGLLLERIEPGTRLTAMHWRAALRAFPKRQQPSARHLLRGVRIRRPTRSKRCSSSHSDPLP
jgi:hypothetical protein